MTNPKNEDVHDANARISRPDEKHKPGRGGKVFAGQRYEFAQNPVGDEGGEKSETERVVEQASRNGDRK